MQNKSVHHTIMTFIILNLLLLLGHVFGALQVGDAVYNLSASLSSDERSPQAVAVSYSAAQDIYLAAWQQGDDYYEAPESDIYGVRGNHAGVLDQPALPICKATGSQTGVKIASCSNTFLAVWQDYRNGSDWDLYGARITGEGQLPDGDGFLIAGGVKSQCLPSVAPDSAGFLIVYQEQDSSGYYHIFTKGVDLEGHVVDYGALSYQDTVLFGGSTTLARVGNTWFLSWANEKANTIGSSWATRRFARIKKENGRMMVIEARTPTQWSQFFNTIGATYSNGFATDGVGKVLFVSDRFVSTYAWFVKPCMTMFTNTAAYTKADTLFPDITLYPSTGVTFGQGVFLAVAQGADDRMGNLYAGRIDTSGVRLDQANWPVVHTSQYNVCRPALVGSDNGFVMAFEEYGADGERSIKAKFLSNGATAREGYSLAHIEQSLRVSPNPFSSCVSIQLLGLNGVLNAHNASLRIFDMSGKVVKDFSRELTAGNNTSASLIWDAGYRPNGMYIVKAVIDGRVLTRRVAFLK